jgi:hypothetical protein
MGESETALGSARRFDFDFVVEEESSFDFFEGTEEEDASDLRF